MHLLRWLALPAIVAVSLAFAGSALAWSPNVAALQVALRAVNVYHGAIDGVRGPQTRKATRRFQRRKGLRADGVAGPRTRRALGRRGRPPLGSRVMKIGHRGWDVAGLQFMLKKRGFSPGSIDGGFGPRTRAAVLRYQRSRRLGADGLAGPATIGALRRGRRPAPRHRPRRRSGGGGGSGPVRFLRPVSAPIGDRFGMRNGRMHTGIDFPAPYGRRVGAAGRGVTRFAGWNSGGYGYLVVIRHRRRFETWYAHLSRITTWPGERVVGGTRIGYVGSTGRSTGPHLHFEVRRRGRPVNPVPRLLGASASATSTARHHDSELECTGDSGADRVAPPSGSNDPATARLEPC